MSISSISSISDYSTLTTTSTSDTIGLESQRSNVEQQIQVESTSNDDDKTKQEKIHQLQAKLDKINAQIQQKKSDSSNKTFSQMLESAKNSI